MATTTLQRLSRPEKTISNGNSVDLDLTWRDTDGQVATPTAVRYQVFDQLTGVNVSPLVIVENPAAAMEIRVPGNYLPVGAQPQRHLIIQVQGEFETAADVHTELIEILVKRLFSFNG